jgi:hypothetical protein
MVQTPLQQSALIEQTSPVCTQYDGGKQMPLKQSWLQHSTLVVQALPRTAHIVLSGTQAPFEQLPPQHCPLPVQGWLSETHVGGVQTPATHEDEQQSLATAHPAPGCKQPASRPPVLELVVLELVVVVPVVLLLPPVPALELVVKVPMPPPLPCELLAPPVPEAAPPVPEAPCPPVPVLVELALGLLPQPAAIAPPAGSARAA